MESILAEAGGHAGDVVEVLVFLGETESVDVRFEFDGLLQEEEGHVVAEVEPMEAAVTLDVCYSVVLVREELLVAVGVPLAQTNSQAASVFPEGIFCEVREQRCDGFSVEGEQQCEVKCVKRNISGKMPLNQV